MIFSTPLALPGRMALMLALGVVLIPAATRANGIIGDYVFVNTMIGEDPFVDDEITFPEFSWLPQPGQDGTTPTLSILAFEFDRRITDAVGFTINDGYQWLQTPGMKTASGWQNLAITLKVTPYVNDEHEFLFSLGLTRNFAGTGASGANGALLDIPQTGSTTPRLYVAKGFGDLPAGWARPFGVTASIGYQIADTKLKTTNSGSAGTPLFNNGAANQWDGAVAIQYSLPYLQSHVRDFGWPTLVNRLTPIVELAWSSPASQPNRDATQYLFGIGVTYATETYSLGVEALIPGNRQTGSHAGIVAQFHAYLDDMFPTIFGKPLLDW